MDPSTRLILAALVAAVIGGCAERSPPHDSLADAEQSVYQMLLYSLDGGLIGSGDVGLESAESILGDRLSDRDLSEFPSADQGFIGDFLYRVPALRLDPSPRMSTAVPYQEAFRELKRRATERLPGDNRPLLPIEFEIVDARSIRYPGASLSRVGFNETMDRAVVAIDFICGGACGWRGLMFLKWSGNGWREDGRDVFGFY